MHATPSPSKSRAAHLGPERRRPLILDAARAIAAESGIPAVTIGAVAERLAVTRPVVYSCFPDRVALLKALFDREADSLLTATIGAIKAGSADTIETAFVYGIQAWLEVAKTHPDTWRLLTSEPDPAVAEVFGIARLEVEKTLAKQIYPALIAHGIVDLDRKMPTILMLFYSACEAAALSLSRESEKWTPVELGELYGRALWRALSAF